MREEQAPQQKAVSEALDSIVFRWDRCKNLLCYCSRAPGAILDRSGVCGSGFCDQDGNSRIRIWQPSRVPDDISADYLNESRDQPAIAGIIFVTVLASIIVLCRLATRAFLIRRFGFDDALTLLSWLCFIPFVGLCIKLIEIGSGRHYEYIQYVMRMPTVELSEILDFAAHIIYNTTLLFCRMSGPAFYHRVCSIPGGLLRSIKIIFGILNAGYLPQLFIIFHYMPVTGLWPYEWQPGVENYTCLQWGLVYSVNSSVSLVGDLLLFGIPIVMLRVLPRKRKIQLACILLPGTLVIAISIARPVLVILGQWEPDMSWSYNPMLGVEVSEIGATMIALSVPGVKPLVDRFILRRDVSTGGSSSGPKYGKAGGSSRGTALRSLNLRPEHDVLGSRDVYFCGFSLRQLYIVTIKQLEAY